MKDVFYLGLNQVGPVQYVDMHWCLNRNITHLVQDLQEPQETLPADRLIDHLDPTMQILEGFSTLFLVQQVVGNQVAQAAVIALLVLLDTDRTQTPITDRVLGDGMDPTVVRTFQEHGVNKLIEAESKRFDSGITDGPHHHRIELHCCRPML